MMTKEGEEKERDSQFELYADYGRTLRLWLVTYGAGGPALILATPDVARLISASGKAQWILALFLVGVGLQVANAAMNKWAAWYLYRGESDPTFKDRVLYKPSVWYSDQAWTDIVCDLGAMAAFFSATITTAKAVLP